MALSEVRFSPRSGVEDRGGGVRDKRRQVQRARERAFRAGDFAAWAGGKGGALDTNPRPPPPCHEAQLPRP